MFKHNALFLCRENIDIGSNARWSKLGQVRDCVPKDNFFSEATSAFTNYFAVNFIFNEKTIVQSFTCKSFALIKLFVPNSAAIMRDKNI